MFGRDQARNNQTHITPIHTLMFERMLSDSGFELLEHSFNAPSPVGSKRLIKVIGRIIDWVVSGVKGGDSHIFVIRRKQ